MKIYPLILVIACALPNICGAQAHHFSGHSHSHHSSGHNHSYHSSGHSHSYHYSGHSHYRHYSRHGFSDGFRHSSRYRSNDWVDRAVDKWKVANSLEDIHEISAFTGIQTGIQILDNNIRTAAPGYFGSYKFYLLDLFAIILSAGTQAVSGDDTCNCKLYPPGIITSSRYNFSANVITIVAGFSWDYYSKGSLQIYQGFELGMSVIKETDHYKDNTTSSANGYQFNGQFNLAGIRWGKELGVFTELGFGYKGLINMGLSYQVGWKKAHGISRAATGRYD